MKLPLIAALILAFAMPVSAGERFKGKLLYRGETEVWMPAPGVGYQHFKSRGDVTMATGPFPKLVPIRCYGTSYWTAEVSEAEGICIFGRMPDTWTARYMMTDNDPGEQRRERFHRVGNWDVVGGTGAYDGMTGFGTYLAEPGREDFLNVTHWEGEVEMPAATD